VIALFISPKKAQPVKAINTTNADKIRPADDKTAKQTAINEERKIRLFPDIFSKTLIL